MPRTARIDIPGLLQHVMVRGIEKRDIFLDDHDRNSFLDRFSNLLLETGTDCFAWALLPNHVHLFLRPTEDTLSRFMRRLLTGHATTFNLRHQRVGHLFQNRYKSIVCDEETYLLELVRYIHLNPIRAGMVASLDDLDRFPWSGHAALMGYRSFSGQNIEEVLGRFGRSLRVARARYRIFVMDGVSRDQREDLSGGGKRRSGMADDGEAAFDERILGGGTFVKEVWRKTGLTEPETPIPLATLIQRVAEAFNLEADVLRMRKRDKLASDARGVLCFLAVRVLGYNGAEVARMLNISRAGVSAAAVRGEAIVRENWKLNDFLRTI